MFRSYDHLQADVFSRMYSADNGSVFFFFRIFVMIVNDYGDRFNVNRVLLRSWVRIPMEAWMFVCVLCAFILRLHSLR
jgi:hypothetical protein